MTPSSGTGANTAERVPSTMRACPLQASRHAARRSASVSAECSTASGAAKRSRNWPSSCGVRPISGTSTSALLPAASTRSTSRRYTSVLPLPVIPCSTKAANEPSEAPTAATAAFCSGRSAGPGVRVAARGGLGACGGHDPALLAREGGGAEPQRARQGTRQYLAQGVVVVLRRPFDQGEGGGIEQRARVEHLENRLQARARNLRARTRSHDDSDRAAAAKRHAHPRTGWDFLTPRSGLRQVVEQAPQGGVERHPENLAQWQVQQGVKSVTYAAYHASTGCAGARYTGHV